MTINRSPNLALRILCLVLLYFMLVGITNPVAADDEDQPTREEGQAQAPPARVRVGLVKHEMLQPRSDVVGRLWEVRRSVVAAERAGRITHMAVEMGDSVTANGILAQIDDVLDKLDLMRATAQLAETRARVTEGKSRVELTRRHYKYLKELHERGSVGTKEYQDAADAADAAVARLASNQAAVQAADARARLGEERVKRLKVLAPFDGVVVRKMTEVGQWVEQGGAVAEIISRGQIDAVINVSEWLINQVSVAQEIDVLIEPLSTSVVGKVASITPLGANAARTFPVKIRFDDDMKGHLKAGMSVKARVPRGQAKQMLTVPRDAIHRSARGAMVWMNVAGMAMPASVRVLFGDRDRYAIEPIDGGPGPRIEPNIQVVIEGAERLFPHRPLEIED